MCSLSLPSREREIYIKRKKSIAIDILFPVNLTLSNPENASYTLQTKIRRKIAENLVMCPKKAHYKLFKRFSRVFYTLQITKRKIIINLA